MGPKKATNAKSSATKAPTKPVNKGSSVRTSIASKKGNVFQKLYFLIKKLKSFLILGKIYQTK